MQNESHHKISQYAVLSYEIVSSRVRKDIFKKPTLGGGSVNAQWVMKKEKEELLLTLDLTIREKGRQTPIELAFISVKGVFHVPGIAQLAEHELVPPELLHRIGQKTCDIAYGILLTKSVGTSLYGLP